MKERIADQKFAQEALHSLLANGCTHCMDTHSKDARAAGETEQRLYKLNAWWETPWYTDRERAALG
jgi:AhpD family alkylhydroperoxidase